MSSTRTPVQFFNVAVEAILDRYADRPYGTVAAQLVRRAHLMTLDLLPATGLSVDEALAITDLLSGTATDDATGAVLDQLQRYLWAEVADAGPEIFQRWGVDQDALVQRLRSMPAAQRIALISGVEMARHASDPAAIWRELLNEQGATT